VHLAFIISGEGCHELAFKLADFFGVTIEDLFVRDSPEDSAEPEATQ
jgi:hypothetical protein